MGKLHEEDLVARGYRPGRGAARAARHLFSIRQPELYQPIAHSVPYP
jgi:hypothetical protein